jgi:protein-S-isoprenylcysteine O-methyltransferase Ste14
MTLIKVHQHDRSLSLITYTVATLLVYPFLFWGMRWFLLHLPDAWYWSSLPARVEIFGVGFNVVDGILFLAGMFGFLLGQVEHREVSWQNGEVMAENTGMPVALKKDGWYGRVRHPMYQFFMVVSSSLLVTTRSLWGLSISLMLLGVHWIVIVIEEKELQNRFGMEYYQYRKDVHSQFFTRFWAIYLILLYIIVLPGMI